MEQETTLSPSQEALVDLWEEHLRYEFDTRDTEATLATMVEDAYVNHIPTLTGDPDHQHLQVFRIIVLEGVNLLQLDE